MSHLLREHAPITDARLEADRRGGARAPAAGPREPPAGRLLRAARLGALGDEPRARRARERQRAQRRRSEPPRRAAADRAALALRSSRARSCARAIAAPKTSTSTILDAAAQRIVEAENTAVFHAWPKAGIEGITASSPHKPIVRGKSFDDYPGLRGARGRAAAAQRHRRAVRDRARARGLHERRRNGRARRLPAARAPAQDHQGPDRVGARASTGAVVLSMRGGDFAFESGQDLSVGYESHDADASRCTSRSPTASACSRPRRPSRSRRRKGAEAARRCRYRTGCSGDRG